MTQTTTQPKSPTNPASERPLVYVNGRMVPKHQAAINVFDHGLLYGDGIFEGIRVYRGKIFKAGQHMERLYGCAKQLFLEIPISPEEMIEIMRRCITANELIDGYIRLVVTRGEGSLGLNPYHCPTPGIVCIADQIRLFTPEQYEAGMRVVLAHRPKTPIACLDPRIKSLNYLNNIMAKVEAIHLSRALGITDPKDQMLEVVMLNTEGNVTEGSGDNIFMVKGGRLITPPSDAGILEGITRRFVKHELAPLCGVSCQEANFTYADLLDADEIFLTGSAAEIIGVREIVEHDGKGHITKNHTITDGEGPITNKLRMKFREIARGDNVPED